MVASKPLKNSKLQVGIVGLGRIADMHFPGYKNNKQAAIYAVCDANEQLAHERKEQVKAQKVYTDYNEMLADGQIDAVEILTPQKLHTSMTIAALEAGKHVALQKPMTIDLENAAQIAMQVDKSKGVFRVTDNYLFYPPIVLAKKIIDNGDIGEVSSVSIKFTSGATGGWEVPASSWQWRMQEKAAGRGIQTFDHGHHLYTTAWYLLGDVERVSADILAPDGIIDCPAVICFKHKDRDAQSVISFTHGAALNIPSDYYTNDEWIEITGSKGIIFILRCTGKVHDGPGVVVYNGKTFKPYKTVKTDWLEGFKGATHNFVAGIRGEQQPALNIEQAVHILKLAFAASESSNKKRAIYLEEYDSSFRYLTYLQNRKKENATDKEGNFFSRLFKGKSFSALAPQAATLTEELVKRFNAEKAKGWACTIEIQLLADGNTEAMTYHALIKNERVNLKKGQAGQPADLVISAKAGDWAAILLKKKKIEIAFIQGKIKLTGKAEEGLKLRSVFGF